jgi:hypothetical protein
MSSFFIANFHNFLPEYKGCIKDISVPQSRVAPPLFKGTQLFFKNLGVYYLKSWLHLELQSF